MQLSNILQMALLVASQGSASPITGVEALTPYAANELVKRANPAPVSCGPTTDQRAWPLESVQDAFNALETYGVLPNPQKPAAGTIFYPHQYGSGSQAPDDDDVVSALNAIPECIIGQAGMKYFEFPITDPVFAGGPAMSQGKDRVVAISPNPGQGGTRSFIYCLAMTHRGGTGPGDGTFRPCTNAP